MRRSATTLAAVVMAATFVAIALLSPWTAMPGASAPAQAACPLSGDATLVEHVGGITSGVVVRDGYAYYRAGPTLRVTDVRDPANPQPTGFTLPGKCCGTALDVALPYAYVTAGDNVLRVIDVSDPAAPTEVGAAALPAEVTWISVGGDTLLALGQSNLLEVHQYDLSEPATPRFVSTTALSEPDGRAFWNHGVVSGDRAYLASSGDAGLWVVDISNREAPTVTTRVDDLQAVRHIALAGELAVASAADGLAVIDLTDPDAPALLSRIEGRANAYATVAVDGDVLLAAVYGAVNAYDISEPSAPVALGSLPVPTLKPTSYGGGLDLALGDGHAFITGSNDSLLAVDVSDPNDLRDVGRVTEPPYAEWVISSGERLYLSGGVRGLGSDRATHPLWVLDATEPVRPQPMGFAPSSRGVDSLPVGMAVLGDHVLVPSSVDGMSVFDVSDPTMPRETSRYTGTLSLTDVATVGENAYLTSWSDGLSIVGIDADGQVFDRASFPSPGRLGGVAVEGDRAYLASGRGAVRMMDVTDPLSPQLLGTLGLPGVGLDVAPAGDRAFAATRVGGPDPIGVFDVDVRAPTEMRERGALDVKGRRPHMVACGEGVLVSTGEPLIYRIDASDPWRLTELPPIDGLETGYYDPELPMSFAFVGDTLFVAARDNGLYVLRVEEGP